MYISIPGVTIGFDPVTYSVNEGLSVEVCARVITGTLEIDAIVTLSSSNGEAEGRPVYPQWHKVIKQWCFVSSPGRFCGSFSGSDFHPK